MSDSPSTDDIPGQNYTQEALLRAAESGDYAKVVDLVTQNTSPVDRLMSGSRPMGEARALSGPDIWYDMLDTKYLGSYMRGSVSFADTVISGGEELWNLGGDIGNYMLGTNRSVMSGEFMPASQLGMSIQTKGWGQTGLDVLSGIVRAPFEVAAGLYHNDPERVGAGLTFWAPALSITSRFSRSSTPSVNLVGDTSGFNPLGIVVDPKASQQGRLLIQQYRQQNPDRSLVEIQRLARDTLQTGDTLPTVSIAKPGDTFYKLIPMNENRGPSPWTEYWMDGRQLDSLQNGTTNIGSAFGLPNKTTASSYKVYQTTVSDAQAPLIFRSNIAPVVDDGIFKAGGQNQTLLPKRSAFSDPIQLLDKDGNPLIIQSR
jgi:hypothetical protein